MKLFPTVRVSAVPACSYWHSHPKSLQSEHFGRLPSQRDLRCLQLLHANATLRLLLDASGGLSPGVPDRLSLGGGDIEHASTVGRGQSSLPNHSSPSLLVGKQEEQTFGILSEIPFRLAQPANPAREQKDFPQTSPQ